MNRNFGHIDATSGEIIYAADTATVHGVTYIKPTAAMYALCTPPELPVSADEPTDPAPDGYHYEPRGWEERDGAIRRVWILVADPPPAPRKFSKLKLYAGLVNAGLWAPFEYWLKGQTIEGVNGYTAFMLAQDLSDDHPLFASLYAAAKSAMGITDEDAERILEAAREE